MSRPRPVAEHHKLRLQSHFGFSRLPFGKSLALADVFDSRSQRDVFHGLQLWLDVRGIACVTGAVGVGKSLTLRRFVMGLDESRYRVAHLTSLPSTPTGFLRAINRVLGLPMRLHATDLFDQAQKHLTARTDDQSPHPVLVLDDAEGMSVELLDLVRRLTAYALDAEDRFSVLLAGTEEFLHTLRLPTLESLRTRISYAQPVTAFSLEDTRNYIVFHLRRAGVATDLFSDEAARRLFLVSQGRPRAINQLALQSLILAAVEGRDQIDADFVAAQIAAHPLYDTHPG
jgi:type II secretory pathway predicted ATPase ExeA